MPPQPIAWRQGWVIEILHPVMLHPQASLDPFRSVVGLGGEGNDLIEIELGEAKGERYLCRLGGIPPPPIRMGKAPAVFHAGREGGGKPRPRQADEADEIGNTRRFHGPE